MRGGRGRGSELLDPYGCHTLRRSGISTHLKELNWPENALGVTEEGKEMSRFNRLLMGLLASNSKSTKPAYQQLNVLLLHTSN